MIHRIQRGKVPPKPHIVFKPEGELAWEHCFTREGFEGLYTIMYHRQPPHWVETEQDKGVHPGWAEPSWDGALRRRHFVANDVPSEGTPFMSRRLVLANSDIEMWVARPTESDDTLVANTNADELTYVHQGKGRLESPLGVLPFEAGDYVYVPKTLTHRFVIDEPSYLFIMAGNTHIDVPSKYRTQAGQLRMDAPYTHRDFRAPEWPEDGRAFSETPKMLRQLKRNRITECELSNDAFDLYGWDGQIWPFAFPISAYQPKTGLVHLPPTTHITFSGAGFVICSFVPRATDFHEQAIPCPYPHSSPSCDEVLFYVSGNFISRKGIGPGSISLHPIGVIHGPHPGTYEGSVGHKQTTEMAVMIDTEKTLLPTDHARKVEDDAYNRSWVS